MATEKTWKKEVLSGIQVTGWILLTFFTLFLLFVGAGIAFTSREKLEFSNIILAKVVAWVAFAVGAGILVYTVQRWVKMLPGLLFLATLNGLLMTYTGHLVNIPSVSVPRDVALVSTLLLAGSSVVSLHFHGRRLNVMDRLALLLFVASLVWGSVSKLAVASLTLGLVALLLAWARNHVQARRASNSG